MKWINDVVFAILAAHVWGSLMLFVWLQAVKRLENKGYTRLLFYLLRAVIVAYLLPLGLGAVLIINEIIEVDARLFQITPVITMISLLLFVIWILGFFANFESLQEKWDITRHCFSDALPASRERQLRFQEICRQTKMRSGRVILCEKAGIRCGGITVGVIHPRIVLPEGKTDEFVEHVTMINMKNAMKKPKIFGVLAAVAVSFTSAGSALASTGILTGGYRALYELTDVEEDEAGIQVLGDINATADNTVPQDNGNINPEDYVNTGIEFIDVLPIDGYTSEKDQSDIELAASANFSWSIPTDFMKATKDFWATSSHHITIGGTITPTGKILRVGIIEPDGIRRCIYATGNFSYNFPLDKTGFYCVYAINDNSEVVNLTGHYGSY